MIKSFRHKGLQRLFETGSKAGIRLEDLMTAMHNPPHPGALLEDYLGDTSLAEASRRLGVTRATLSRIRNGHSGITADMAVRLGILFGTSAELWLGMQANYDLWTERQKPRPAVLPLAS